MAPARVPFEITETTEFRQHTVVFKAGSSGTLSLVFENRGQTGSTGMAELYISDPQISWKEGPGPTSDASVELGISEDKKFVPTLVKVSNVAGSSSCGQMALERCSDWDANDKACDQYHTVATFAVGSDMKLHDESRKPAARWRVSPLTSLPVAHHGRRCENGDEVPGVETAEGCRAAAEAKDPAAEFFSFKNDPEDEATGQRCILHTNQQCEDGQKAGPYVVYKVPRDLKRAMSFPRIASKKFLRLTGSTEKLNAEFSVAFWIKATTGTASGRIISKSRKDGTGWNVRIEDGRVYLSGMGDVKSFWATPKGVKVTTGQWHHITAVFSKTENVVGLYMDGSASYADFDTTSSTEVLGVTENVPITIGREWDESYTANWVGTSNLEGGRKLSGVRLAGIAVWRIKLSANQAKSLFDGSGTPDTESSSGVESDDLVAWIQGVRSDGKVEDSKGSGTKMVVEVRHKNDNSALTTSTLMDAVEDGEPTAELPLVTSNLKSCGMSLSIKAATSESADCIQRNNKHCAPGAKTCEQEECNTPGNDEARVFALCQPSKDSEGNDITESRFKKDNAVSKSTSHVGQEVACPAGTVVALGWAVQTSNDPGSPVSSCFEDNNKKCEKGADGCSQVACDTPGDDIQTIYLFCQPKETLHASPISLALSTSEAECPAGTDGKVCNDLEQTVKCPENAEILFGFGLHHTSSFKSGTEEDRLKSDKNTICKYGKKSCSLPYAVDTAGHDTSMLYAVCAGAINYEVAEKYELVLEATDPSGLTGRGVVTVNVVDRNEQPSIDDAVVEVKEDADVGAIVGAPVEAEDPDNNDLLFYTIIGGDGMDLFDVGRCTGQLFIKQALLDHETKDKYTLTLQVRDDGRNPDELSDECTVIVNVVDVNEPPQIYDGSCSLVEARIDASREISNLRLANGDDGFSGRVEYKSDDGSWGSLCGTTSDFSDDDAKVVCAQLGLLGGKAAATRVDKFLPSGTAMSAALLNCNGDEVSLRDCPGFGKAGACDPSNENEVVSVVCENPWYPRDDKEADGSPKPTNVSHHDFSRMNNCQLGEPNIMRVHDVDDKDTGTWSIVGGNPGTPWPLFDINPDSGVISVSPKAEPQTRAELLNHEAYEAHDLEVMFTDAGGLSSKANLHIVVIDVNEDPHFAENPFPSDALCAGELDYKHFHRWCAPRHRSRRRRHGQAPLLHVRRHRLRGSVRGRCRDRFHHSG